jgi:capsule biosynthesis phosphatase
MTVQKRLVVDVDGVIAKNQDVPYSEKEVNKDVLDKIRQYKNNGFYIILYTARNMNSYKKNLGKINAETAPVLYEWLQKNNIPFDEIYYQKPWNGNKGFYIDDNAIRPDEFIGNGYSDIMDIIR